MKFICKGCGKETQLSLGWGGLRGTYCVHCGRSIPNGRRYFLVLQGGLFTLLNGSEEIFSRYWELPIMISLLANMVLSIFLLYLLMLAGIWWEGRTKVFPFEGKGVRPTICPNCKEEVSLFCGNSSVKCTNCGEVFFQKESTEMEREIRTIKIVGFVLTLVLTIGVSYGLLNYFPKIMDHYGIYSVFGIYYIFLIGLHLLGTKILCHAAKRKGFSNQ